MKKSCHSFGVAFAFACGLAVSAAAGDKAVWTNVTDRTASWRTVGNWTDDQGAPLAAAPGNGEDITLTDVPALPAHGAYVADNQMLGEQTVSYVATDISFQMGAVKGDAHHTLGIDSDGGPADNTQHTKQRDVTVGDPAGFLGFWRFGGMELQVTTPASASLMPVYHNFSAKHSPVLKGSDAAGTTVIDSLYEAGALEKADAGALRIKATSGEQTLVYLKGSSTLVLDGKTDDALETLLDRAALHLDASVEDSLTKEPATDGLVSVRRWKDVRGETGRYYFDEFKQTHPAGHEIKNSNPPFLSVDAKSPTGLPLVDFGARSTNGLDEYPERGRTNCVMRLGKGGDATVRLTGVREAFYAVSAPKGAGAVQILGDSKTIHYMCSNDTTLFSDSYSDPAVRHGDIIFNTGKHAFNGFAKQQLTDLYTLGLGVGRDTAVSWLGSRQLYASTTGGSRMGEILLFTNDLTRAERLMVCRYLDAKWRTGDTSESDLTALHVSSTVPTVNVPAEDCTARIGMVEVPGKVLNKTGDGTLVVGRLTDGTKINVQGGKVAFSGAQVAASSVAANPYVHLDAASIGADDVEVVDEVSYVNTWKDENYGVERQATAALEGTSRPTLITSALVGGKKVVDFGARQNGSGTGAWMKLCNWNTTSSHQAYAGFMVLRSKATGQSSPHFGSSQGMTFYRDSYAAIISPFYKNNCLGAALWRVNGAIEQPFSSSVLNQTERFVVLSFSSGYPVQLDAIVADKGGQSSVKDSGGLEVGEVVVYDRPLSEQELLSTEAYLMKKWLGAGPAGGTTVSELTVGEGEPADLTSDQDLTIGKLTGGDGSIVKGGSGAVTVGTLGTPPTAISVLGGTLALTLTDDLISSAVADFDASRTDLMTLADQTNVLAWVSATGTKTRTMKAVTNLPVTKRLPSLATVETADGVQKRVVDFGEYCSQDPTSGEVSGGVAAAMNLDLPVYFGEAFTVFSDAHGSRKCWVMGDSDNYVGQTSGHPFGRGVNGQFIDNADRYKGTSVSRNSRHYVDDMSKNLGWSGVIPPGFHVLRSSLTNGSTQWLTYESIKALANGCNELAGGAYFAEQLVFSRILTNDEAKQVGDYLKWKWLGAERPAMATTNEISEIVLANGALLTLRLASATVDNTVSALSGSGTLDCAEVTGVSTLGFACDENGWDAISVLGKVRFAKDVTVNLSVPHRGVASAGEYVLLEAEDLGDADPSGWTVNVTGTGLSRFDVSIRRDGNSIVLCLRKHGAVLIVR